MNKILCFSLLTAFATMTSAAPPPQPLGCLIQADQVAELGSAVTGIIDSIKVERGDTVRRGQVLATLRDAVERAQIDVARSRAEIEAEIRGAQANLDLANDRQRRANDLFARNFVSSQAVEQADADVRIAQEKLQQARDLQRVSKRELDLAEARLSERVEERALLRVAKLNPLRVEVVLPNTLYGSIEPGMVADIRPDLPGLDLINATVTRVDKVLDAASNTFRARLELPNPNNRIPAGVRCKASFANAGGAGTETAPQPKATAPRASSSRADMSFDTVLTRFRPGQQPRPERRL
jgi:multidrug efflux pump subunit AcrA (membrane-fusion protein)